MYNILNVKVWRIKIKVWKTVTCAKVSSWNAMQCEILNLSFNIRRLHNLNDITLSVNHNAPTVFFMCHHTAHCHHTAFLFSSQSLLHYLCFFEVKTCPLFVKKKVRVFDVQIWKKYSSNTIRSKKNLSIDKTDFVFYPVFHVHGVPVQ